MQLREGQGYTAEVGEEGLAGVGDGLQIRPARARGRRGQGDRRPGGETDPDTGRLSGRGSELRV